MIDESDQDLNFKLGTQTKYNFDNSTDQKRNSYQNYQKSRHEMGATPFLENKVF